MIQWPKELVDDIAARRSILFLGAGVSKHAANSSGEHPMDWIQYLNHLAALIDDARQKSEVVDSINSGDLLTACELCFRYLRAPRVKSEMLNEFLHKRFQPARIHEDLSRIDSRFVLTTNFDRLYEQAANNIQQGTVLIKNYYDTDVADIFRRNERAVLKVHGTVDLPDLTIFTRSQYARARRKYAHFYQLLSGLFVTHTFIFLGASMRDPDIQLLLEDHAYNFEGSRPHYMVMPQDSSRPGAFSLMEETMNLSALRYDPADNHIALGNSIAALVPLVEAARERLSETAGW